jgi:two-component system, sensor histidine kinase and response regulator
MAGPSSDQALQEALSDPQRLRALELTGLLDSEPEPEFDRLTRLAARLLDVPVALTSLVDDERQFFKSCVGLAGPVADERGTPLSHSFCKHVVHTGQPLVIPDAREMPLVRENLAIPDLDVIAYLGIPLLGPGGQVLGSFCAIDHEPRDWSDEDVSTMEDIAHAVMTEIELRDELRVLRATEAELARARDAALDASRLKSEFVANMSHELRTPLNGVIGMTELLLATELDEEQRRYVETAAGSGEALLAVINDVLDFSKIEAGKLDLDPHEFDLHETIEQTGEIFAVQAQGKGLELTVRIADDLPRAVRGDRARVRQILTNLLSNAIKFTPAGEIQVAAGTRGGADGQALVQIEVTDTGIGIEPAKVAALFDPFSQADGSTTRHYGGTGLGLAISRQLAELMGGEIGATSRPGEGSRFFFTVRLDVLAEIPPGIEQPRAPLPDGLRALVVDANATSLDIVCGYLATRGLDCRRAADARAARELLRAGPYELVIAHGAAGFELAAGSELGDARLILLTGSGEDRAAARRAGIRHILTKPVRRDQLLEAIAAAVGPAPASPAPAAAPERPDVAGARVLIAEDNPVNQLVIEGMLSKRGIAADMVSDGHEALARLDPDRHRLVLMDCQMPEMDGYEATTAIREREAPDQHVPIIAMTAHAMAGARERCLAVGMDDYLSKPLRPDALDEVLDRWLEPPAANGATADLIDDDRVRHLQEELGPMTRQVLDIFERTTPPLLAELRATADPATTQSLAHRLKGSCANLGARAMAEQCEALERGDGDADALVRLYEPTLAALRDAVRR